MSTTIASTKKYEDMSAKEKIAPSPTESPRDRGRRPERKFSALTETPTRAAATSESRTQLQQQQHSGSRTRERQYSSRDHRTSNKADDRDSTRRYTADERESKSRDRDRSRERR